MRDFFLIGHKTNGNIDLHTGRFPFNKNPRFIFSEFSLVEWNASDRFPDIEVTCRATQGMLDETLLCLKMADFYF